MYLLTYLLLFRLIGEEEGRTHYRTWSRMSYRSCLSLYGEWLLWMGEVPSGSESGDQTRSPSTRRVIIL